MLHLPNGTDAPAESYNKHLDVASKCYIVEFCFRKSCMAWSSKDQILKLLKQRCLELSLAKTRWTNRCESWSDIARARSDSDRGRGKHLDGSRVSSQSGNCRRSFQVSDETVLVHRSEEVATNGATEYIALDLLWLADGLRSGCRTDGTSTHLVASGHGF